MNSTRPKALCVALSPGLAAEMATLLRADFECLLVASTQEAERKLNDDAGIALLITDASQGAEAACLELQRTRQRRWPDTVGIMVVAENALETALAALQDGSVFRVVRMPWQAQSLATTLAEARAYFDMRGDERRLREQLARINAELDEKIQDLDEANELLEYWVEFSPAVLYSFSCEDGQLHPSYISKNFHRLTGFERTAAVVDAGFWRELLHPADATRYRDVLKSLTEADGNFAVVEYRVRHRDGSYVTVVDSMRAVRDAEGATIEVVGAWMDVSARA
jgi:PAS domain S-box-containing protein